MDEERAKKGLEPIFRPSMASEAEKEAHKAEMEERRKARNRRYQKELRQKDKTNYNEYRRIQGGISRSKKAVENWTAKGNEVRAAQARQKLAEYEEEMKRFRGA